MNSFRPSRDNLLIKPLEHDSVTPLGIHLPDNANGGMKYLRGTVVSVGPGQVVSAVPNARHAPEYAPGDVVCFTEPEAGWPRVEVAGETHLVILPSAVLGVEDQ